MDLLHIENRANDIVKSEKTIQLVLGQLINEWVLSGATCIIHISCFLKCILKVMASLCYFWSEIHFSWLLLGLLDGDQCFFSKCQVRPVLGDHPVNPWSKGLAECLCQYPALKRLHFLPSVFVYSSQISFALWLCYLPHLLTFFPTSCCTS